MERKPRIFTVYLCFLVALVLEIMPLPDWVVDFRPKWLALVLFYWTLALPGQINIGHAWLLGLIMDVLSGSLLGQHALGFSVLTFAAFHLHQQIRNFPLWEQSLVMSLIVAAYMALMLWIDGIRGRSPESWMYWAPLLSNFLLWPWLYLILQGVQQRHVSGLKRL